MLAALPDRAATVLTPLAERFPELEACYLDFHRHPELSGHEVRTSALAAGRLADIGYEVTSGVGGHGVVGILRNGDGPVVLLRADMDALPVEEKTGLSYASTATASDGAGNAVAVSHACGHDAHLSCLLGAADLLASARPAWRGCLVVVAQPAEESGRGAEAMLRDGLYTRFPKPDVALAQHVVPLPVGILAHREGPMMAASTVLKVTIFGRGGHGSVPHTTVDPVVIAGHVITRLQTIVAREIDPADFAVVTVGTVRAGTRANVVPDHAELGISVRAYTEEVQSHLIRAVERVVLAEAVAAGAPSKPIVSVAERVPVNDNSVSHTRTVEAAHRAVFGLDRVVAAPPLPASEDFPYFGAAGAGALYAGPAVPTVYWLVGSTAIDVWQGAPGDTPKAKLAHLPINHSPLFAPDPGPTLRTGVTALVAAALAFLPSAQ